jgi:hypothetical protein
VSGRLRRMFLMSSCKPRNIACVVESIGVFVADISVVATRNDLSHDVTILMDSQLVFRGPVRSGFLPKLGLTGTGTGCLIWILG